MVNKGNKKLSLPVNNKTNLSTNLGEKKKNPKARCQVGNIAMKTNLPNMLRGRERKKRQKEQICKVRGR